MGAFMVIVLRTSPQEAYDAFRQYHSQLVPFRDASKGECHYDCTILHCL
jgi:hypothetical protein